MNPKQKKLKKIITSNNEKKKKKKRKNLKKKGNNLRKHCKNAKLPWHHTFDSLRKIEEVEKSLGKNWNKVGIFSSNKEKVKKSWKKKLESSCSWKKLEKDK